MASRCSAFLPEDDCDSQDRHLLGDNYPHNATSDSRPSLSIINKELDVSSMGEITLYEDRNKHCEERYSLPPSPKTGHRNRQCFSPVLFLSTLWVVTAASGLATALLVWIYLHGTQRSIDEIWREGAFLLDEGTHLDGGFPASRLMGLTISSASVSEDYCLICIYHNIDSSQLLWELYHLSFYQYTLTDLLISG